VPSVPADDTTLTPYSPLSHKAIIRGDRRGLNVAPGWVPDDELPRLAAYYVRAAYLGNSARHLLAATVDPTERRELREYGDPALIVDRYHSAVLGADWTIAVAGADTDPPDRPDLPAEPDPPADDATDVEQRIYQIARDRWEADVTAAVDAWADQIATAPAARARQAAIDTWLDNEHVRAVVDEAELDTCGLGDTVIAVRPQPGGWPRLQVFEPAVFFPVEDEYDDGRFPTKVHLAWEYDQRNLDGTVTTRLRRITYELVLITSTRVDPTGAGWVDTFGEPADAPPLADNERVTPEGLIERCHPWDQTSDGIPASDDAWSP